MDAHEITGTLEEVKGKAEKQYGQVKDKVRTTARELEDFSVDAQKNGESTWSDVSELISDNPGAAVGIALLVGAALGALVMGWAQD